MLEHFSFSQHSELVYKFQNAQRFIEVACDETGNIKSITPSTDFPPDELYEIDKKIQDTLLTKHGTKICQIIGFCGLPITGYFRYKDWFQMLPVPEDAPKPKVLLADHPFILEVPYETCPSLMIDASRKQKKAVIYSRLLNVLSNQFISLGSLSRHAWVVLNTENMSSVTSEWKQLGYFYYNRLKGAEDEFSSVDNLHPIEKVFFRTYYSSPPLARTMDPFTFPDNLEQSLDKAFALDGENWRKFFMACSWYAQYRYTAKESRSSAFIALVTALECLGGQPRYRVTVHFKEFLKKYFPAIDQFPKEKKTIYQVRSQLAHGADLLRADLEPWNFLVDTTEEDQGQLQRNLLYIARLAIYNWLQTVSTACLR